MFRTVIIIVTNNADNSHAASTTSTGETIVYDTRTGVGATAGTLVGGDVGLLIV